MTWDPRRRLYLASVRGLDVFRKVRGGWEAKLMRWRGQVRVPGGSLESRVSGPAGGLGSRVSGPRSPEAYDAAARWARREAQRWAASKRRRFDVEQERRGVLVRRVFQAPCPAVPRLG